MSAMDVLISLGAVALVMLLAPLLGWMLQGVKVKRSAALGSVMEGFAAVFETQQTRVKEAHREKKRPGRTGGDPPDLAS